MLGMYNVLASVLDIPPFGACHISMLDEPKA
jgi:hypothetical protein